MVGRGGALARLVVLGGLLVGLFLMHGSPASAVGGCHAVMGAGASADRTGQKVHEGHEPSGGPVVKKAAGHGSAESCVSTRPRDGVPLGGPVPVLGVGDPVRGVASAEWPSGDGCRAPPGGRALLLRKCVART
ncbi:hypothetical protein GCM10010440_04250 [Kitasatospora cinereorecta]